MGADNPSGGAAAQLDRFLDSRAVVLTHEIREAWYLMEHPAAALEIDTNWLPDTAGADAARSMIRLLDLEKEANSRALVAARQRVHRPNAEFFELYMARRRVRYG